jgi:hypothetical protein
LQSRSYVPVDQLSGSRHACAQSRAASPLPLGGSVVTESGIPRYLNDASPPTSGTSFVEPAWLSGRRGNTYPHSPRQVAPKLSSPVLHTRGSPVVQTRQACGGQFSNMMFEHDLEIDISQMQSSNAERCSQRVCLDGDQQGQAAIGWHMLQGSENVRIRPSARPSAAPVARRLLGTSSSQGTLLHPTGAAAPQTLSPRITPRKITSLQVQSPMHWPTLGA